MTNVDSEERRHVESTKLDVDRAQTDNVRSLLLRALKMKWKLKKRHQDDNRILIMGKS